MELPKPLARLLNTNKLNETIIRKGFPYIKMWTGILEKAREEIKKYVVSNGPVELSETTELVIEETSFEYLSKQSILEAKGEKEGEKILDLLRKDGCLKESRRASMVERGKKAVSKAG